MRPYGAVANFKSLGAVTKGLEQILIRAGEPCLAGIGEQFLEQCGAAISVQVRGGFVNQDERGTSAEIVREGARLRQNEADEQRFLFAGRALLGGHVFRRMARFQIRAVRAIEGAASAGVTRARAAQRIGEMLLNIGALGAVFERTFEQAFKRERGFRKGAVGALIDRLLQTMQSLHARGGNGGAMRGHFAFETAEPGVVEDAVRQKALALAQRALIGRCGGAMLRRARERQTIEEAATIASGA